MKNRIRMTVDISMTVLLPLLMAYSLISETFHEIAGVVIFVLFIAHQILNRRWYAALLIGRYTAKRIFQTAVNSLLVIFMILQPISGIVMSKHLFTFLEMPGAATARQIHLALAYWGFALMCLHAGTHLTAPLSKLKRARKPVFYTVLVLLTAVSFYGVYAFIKRQIADYMFMRSAFVFFDFSEPRAYFFLDYIAIMALFATLGAAITLALWGIGKAKDKQKGFRPRSRDDGAR